MKSNYTEKAKSALLLAEKSAKKSADSSKNLEKRFEQILNELVSMNKIITSGATKGRRYI